MYSSRSRGGYATVKSITNGSVCCRNGCTALNYAVDASQQECVTIALDSGADIESRDRMQWTPLMRAGKSLTDSAH